ncbi:MAG TPA: peptidylprolyl isomerase [Myxococcales bacterium]|nr:peptidylprolyl isomerase [Myxococcales bacterium]
MKVAPKRVVSLEYSLHLGDHQVIDSSEGEPLSYLHGTAQIIPGLERQLEGMEPGESKQVTIAPADGYGERDPSNVQEVPRTAFGDRELHEGDELVAIDDEQNEVPVRIEKLVGDKVMVDFNHPLAGKTLHFEVTIRDVREASDEEIAHGHAHDGHHHH